MQNQDRLMEQLMQLDMSQNNILTVQALAQAADAGKANLKANDLENVEEVLDDIADQNTQMAQMQDALAMPTGMMADMDGDELDDELAVRLQSRCVCFPVCFQSALKVAWVRMHITAGGCEPSRGLQPMVAPDMCCQYMWMRLVVRVRIDGNCLLHAGRP